MSAPPFTTATSLAAMRDPPLLSPSEGVEANANGGAVEAALSERMRAEVEALRATFNTGRTRDLSWRRKQLNQILLMIKENHEEITKAVRQDHLNSPKIRGFIDLKRAGQEVSVALKSLDDWTADKPSTKSAPMFGEAFVRPEPKGVMLLISPWNYPVAMVLDPLIPIIAAGNCCIIKPSEVSSHSAEIIYKLIDKYMDRSAVRCVLGGVPETSALLEQKFDHIMYTGNGSVGRIVMRAAAEHLTPCTLELGGKSPTYVDSSCANVEGAATKIMWWKYVLNVGQTCIAPDYVLLHRDVEDEFIAVCKRVLKMWFGETESEQKKNKTYARVINSRHVQRIRRLMDGTRGDIIAGGSVDEAAHYIAPTIIKVPNIDEPLMREEIFGPVLPIMVVDSVEDAIRKTNTICSQPLALYMFADDEDTIESYLRGTQSGGVCINSAFEHQTSKDLPFGGVGESGMGRYHGKWGFDEFSHHRSVFRRSSWSTNGGLAVDPRKMHRDKTYDLIMKLSILGFLSPVQKTMLKAMGAGALAVLGARFFRPRM